MATCVLVLGTPRSGSSAVAGVLHHLGVRMGEDFVAPNDWYPKGLFCDRELTLAACFAESDPEAAGRITAIAKARDAQGVPWGFKCPAIAANLEAFLAGAGGDVRIIATARPLAEVNASAAKRTGRPEKAADRCAALRGAIADALRRTRITPVLTVTFAELLADPAKIVGQIAAAVGLPVTQQAVAWIDPTVPEFADG